METSNRLLAFAAFSVLAAGCSTDMYSSGAYDPAPAAYVSPAVVPAGGGYVEPAPIYEYYVTPGPTGDVYFEYPPDSYYWDRPYRNYRGRPHYKNHYGPRHGSVHGRGPASTVRPQQTASPHRVKLPNASSTVKPQKVRLPRTNTAVRYPKVKTPKAPAAPRSNRVPPSVRHQPRAKFPRTAVPKR